MIIKIPKPKNDSEFVNLYNTAVTLIKENDSNLRDYMLEANICDDCNFEEIAEMLASYYGRAQMLTSQLICVIIIH